jgi:hypothetical protein
LLSKFKATNDAVNTPEVYDKEYSFESVYVMGNQLSNGKENK